jgi:hypothetical protein
LQGVDVGGDAPLYLALLGIRGWLKVALRNQENPKVTFCWEIQRLKLAKEFRTPQVNIAKP